MVSLVVRYRYSSWRCNAAGGIAFKCSHAVARITGRREHRRELPSAKTRGDTRPRWDAGKVFYEDFSGTFKVKF